jgi:ribosome biogenesis GTPase A
LKNFSIFFLVIGIFGNKADLVDEEKVDEALVREFAKEKKAFFSRTSAKTGSGVEQSIIKLVSEFLKVRKNKESPFGPVREESDKGNIDINNSVKKKGGKCCF